MFGVKQTLMRGLIAARPACQKSAAKIAAVSSTRAFSNLGAISNGATKLSRALDKEIKYENENYTQLEDIEQFLNESGFEYTEEDNGIFMTLKKKVGTKTVEVVFEARQPIPDSEQNPDQEQEHEEEEEGLSENYCDFTVYIQEEGQSGGMIVEATTMDTEINYNAVQMSDNIAEDRKIHRFERQMRQYAGPDFTTLEERIQTSLTEYLEGYGIDEHLSAFVECMSLDKDQRLYMDWLKRCQEFVEEK